MSNSSRCYGVERADLIETRRLAQEQAEGRTAAGLMRTERKDLVLALLERTTRPMTSAEVAKMVGLFEHQATRALGQLRGAGLATQRSIFNSLGPHLSVWTVRLSPAECRRQKALGELAFREAWTRSYANEAAS